MSDPTEQEIIAKLDEWKKGGRVSRDTGVAGKLPDLGLRRYMHSIGWMERDLQIALCVNKTAYRHNQLACGNVTEELLIANGWKPEG